VRFRGFSKPWAEIEVGKTFRVTRGYVLPATVVRQDVDEEYIYPVYSSQTKDNGLMRRDLSRGVFAKSYSL
jgi:type I restriction enzyme S subunit